MPNLNMSALQSMSALDLLAMLGGNVGKSRKTRSDKGFTKDLVAEAQSVDERKAALEAATIAAFTKAGYKDIQPRVNVLTYGKVKDDGTKTGWLALGRKVKKGETSVHVKAKGMRGKGIPMFHISQTEPIEAAPVADAPQS